MMEKLTRALNRFRRLNQDGDTLVEITIALAILGSVIVGAFVLAGSAYRLGAAARERSQAVNLLQEQAEALRNYRDSRSWSAFNSGISASPGNFHMARSGNSWVPAAGPWTDPSVVPQIFRTGTSRIFISASGAGNIKFITITAEWTGPDGRADRTSITTQLANLDGLAPS